MKYITKICVWDFDGTLINTELPETGKVKWKESKGVDWPHQGWWGKAESLDIDIFENNIIEHVVEAYNKERESIHTLNIMLTGRRAMLSVEVEKILDKHSLVFDRKEYNTGGETITCKIKTLEKLLLEYSNVELIELYEDRSEHVQKFKEWGETIKQKVIVNFVEPVIERFKDETNYKK